MSERATKATDALRLAFGTLTVVPVRPPRVDRETAGRAMVLAPVVGLVLALAGWTLLTLLGAAPVSSLLASGLVLGLLALLTRGLHLDGLADTADGLGSGKPPAGALEVMRRGDVGPFGVVTLVLVLLVQAAALAQLLVVGLGPLGLGLALVVSRLALPLACTHAVPGARPEGLGAMVARAVSPAGALVAAALAVLGATLLAALAVLLDGPDAGVGLAAVAVASLGLLPGAALTWWAVRRLGGVTGDVLGALVETTFTATLVLLCLLP